ncbi:MAG: hypothetical protein K0S57_3069 [Ramlibacter sp.]|nr:hypothetical protein [Ramlibacter sp.]
MRRKEFLRYSLAVVAGAAAAALAACGGGDSAELASTATLDDAETAALRYMREEEKLAHDVYAVLYVPWGLQIFSNIAASETQHTEAILQLLLKYGVDDPAAGRAVGEFEDASIKALFDQLVAAGRVNEVEALKVGALIEETDIRDINSKMAITDNPDILQVYDALLCGSGNHLRAFNAQLLANGVTYVPQVISQAEWDAIASAPASTCGG